jgi:IS30 family transposase
VSYIIANPKSKRRKKAHHEKLTGSERKLIAKWLGEGKPKKEIARLLGRDIKTVKRELKRNRTRVQKGDNDWEYIYEPEHAQHMAEDRKKNAWLAKQPLKNKLIYSYAMEKLRLGWSPEQIAGRLRYEHPDDPLWHICHETIYQFIYREKTDKTRKGLLQEGILDKRKKGQEKDVATVTDHDKPLWEYLRRKQKKRRKRSGRKVHRVRIPDRVSIHNRPKEIDARTTFGHYEGDSIVGLGHRNGIHTEYERFSSFILARKMARIDTESFVQAAVTIFSILPEEARISSTLDNGVEHTDHKRVTKKAGIFFYFADPYSSFQRGGNENCNLWIRYYLPKKTDFSTVTEEELQDIIWEINNRPRKRLGFKTAQEVFIEQLEKLGVDRAPYADLFER